MGLTGDLIDLLSTGGFVACPIYGGDLPERPPRAIVVTPTIGLGSTHGMGGVAGSPLLESLRFQVRARAEDYATAESTMDLAHAILNGLRRRAVNGKTYQFAQEAGTPFYVGLDEEERPLFACNYSVLRTRST